MLSGIKFSSNKKIKERSRRHRKKRKHHHKHRKHEKREDQGDTEKSDSAMPPKDTFAFVSNPSMEVEKSVAAVPPRETVAPQPVLASAPNGETSATLETTTPLDSTERLEVAATPSGAEELTQNVVPVPAAQTSAALTNQAAAKALRARLRTLPPSKPKRSLPSSVARPREVEILSSLDLAASTRLAKARATAGERRKLGVKENKARDRSGKAGADGERVGYFEADATQVSLAALVRQERVGVVEDIDANLARYIAKHEDYSQADTDARFDAMDTSVKEFERRAAKDEHTREQRERQAAVKEHSRHAAAVARCWYCVDGPRSLSHLHIHCTPRALLALPAQHILNASHCVIGALSHGECQRSMDEDVWAEVLQLKRALVKFFAREDCGVIFVETVRRNRGAGVHGLVDCIPMPMESFQDASLFFRKALLEVDAQWAVNKRVVDMKTSQSVRHAIPGSMPYFAVEFGLTGGFAHPIETDKLFPDHFGKSVLCGILGESPQFVLRPRREAFVKERERAAAFKTRWKEFSQTEEGRACLDPSAAVVQVQQRRLASSELLKKRKREEAMGTSGLGAIF